MLSNQFLKIKNSFLEPEKDFMELKDRELKDGEELFYKAIIVSKDGMDIWTLFEPEEEKEEGKKRKHNQRIIEDRIIRDIGTLFEQEDYYEPKRVSNF